MSKKNICVLSSMFMLAMFVSCMPKDNNGNTVSVAGTYAFTAVSTTAKLVIDANGRGELTDSSSGVKLLFDLVEKLGDNLYIVKIEDPKDPKAVDYDKVLFTPKEILSHENMTSASTLEEAKLQENLIKVIATRVE